MNRVSAGPHGEERRDEQMAPNPRDRRLSKDQESINELTGRSSFIDAAVVSRTPAGLPEVWEITYHCKGIVGVNPDQSPIYGQHHQVRISLGKDYPRVGPDLLWLTEIWHPNIRHRSPRMVCINAWNPGRALDATVLMLGEMIQYKNYHAADRSSGSCGTDPGGAGAQVVAVPDDRPKVAGQSRGTCPRLRSAARRIPRPGSAARSAAAGTDPLLRTRGPTGRSGGSRHDPGAAGATVRGIGGLRRPSLRGDAQCRRRHRTAPVHPRLGVDNVRRREGRSSREPVPPG
jgi:ubiquitin-protein ligase